jgi:hypothetical protein
MNQNFSRKIFGAATMMFLAGAMTASAAHHTQTFSEQALKDMRAISVNAEKNADLLKTITSNPMYSPELQRQQLNALKYEFNTMGKKVALLEAQHDALPAWQQRAVEEMKPALVDAAKNTDEAIRYFNANRTHLFSMTNREFSNNIATDAEKIAGVLSDSLRYNHARRVADSLDQKLSTGNSSN